MKVIIPQTWKKKKRDAMLQEHYLQAKIWSDADWFGKIPVGRSYKVLIPLSNSTLIISIRLWEWNMRFKIWAGQTGSYPSMAIGASDGMFAYTLPFRQRIEPHQ